MSDITYNSLPESITLPVYFFTASCHHSQENIIRPKGVPGFYQIIFIVEGKGKLKCQGHTFELKKGCAFFNAPEIPVEYINQGGLVTAFISAVGTGIGSILRHFSNDGFLFYESVNLENYVFEINRIIQKHNNDKQEGFLSAMVYSIFMDFFEKQNNNLSQIEKIALYCDKHFAKKLTLEQLSDMGCMCISKLCHDFKAKYNTTVFKYILNLRLNYARTILLSNPIISIKEVAISSGFDDVSYFCRTYKQKFSKTPTEEQKQF